MIDSNVDNVFLEPLPEGDYCARLVSTSSSTLCYKILKGKYEGQIIHVPIPLIGKAIAKISVTQFGKCSQATSANLHNMPDEVTICNEVTRIELGAATQRSRKVL